MNILRVREAKILNFKSARRWLLFLFVRAARALVFENSIELGVGIYDSEDRRIFSGVSQISNTLEHGFCIRAKRTSALSSKKNDYGHRI